MLSYKYLNQDTIISAITSRPKEQTVIITGRNANKAIKDLADTISDIKDEKHAYYAGIMARQGVDF